jgi:hypothetical protein
MNEFSFRCHFLVVPALVVSLLTVGCEKKATVAAKQPTPQLTDADVPVLKISDGQEWTYRVTIENPKHSLTGEPASGSFERIRRFVGSIEPGGDRPPTDCFEVRANGAKTLREYVSITPEEVSIVGQAFLNDSGVQENLIWLEHPITFFRAGLMAGDSLPLVLMNKDKKLWRMVRVIGREKIKVPAGEFDTVRLQMIGQDGPVAIRRSYWFCPGVGIVREEKIREVDGKAVFSETDELIGQSGRPK